MSTTTDPVLVACAHGTDNEDGRAAVAQLCAQVRAARPGLDVVETWVDVQHPQLPEVLASLDPDRPAVVVPLLLTVGYHTRVDIARAVKDRPHTIAADPLGPDPRLADILVRKLDQIEPDDGIVLAAAGSSDPRAAVEVEKLVHALDVALDQPVLGAYLAATKPTVPDAVETLSAQGAERVHVASYLLAPGYFHDRLADAGADAVSAPLLPAEELAHIVLDRFDAATRNLTKSE